MYRVIARVVCRASGVYPSRNLLRIFSPKFSTTASLRNDGPKVDFQESIQVMRSVGKEALNDDREDEIISLTQRLLKCITTADYKTYCELCDPDLTSFEPEALGNLVEGMEFHKYYFDYVLSKRTRPINTTLLYPRVHLLGEETACICYVRLTQFINSSGQTESKQSEETRIWHKRNGNWIHVHFHRSGSP